MSPTWARTDGRRRARVRGAMSLAASASALMVQLRDEPAASDVQDRVPASPPAPLRRTADTSMMLVLGDHLVRHGGLVRPEELAVDLAAEWRTDPDRGYRQSTADLLRAVTSAEPVDSLGWLTPVGLLPGLGRTAVAGRAQRACGAIDEHPLALDAATVYATAIHVLAGSAPSQRPDPDSLVDAVCAAAHTAAFTTMLRQVPRLTAPTRTPQQAADTFAGHSGVLPTVAVALAAFLRHPDQPPQAIGYTLSVLPEPGSAAVMAAAGLCGAWAGESALPVTWGIHLESATRLWTVATALAALDHTRVLAG